ncbi:MAG: transaldolase [Pseudomonadota bacterium]
MSRIRSIKDFGQQVWLDYFSRDLLESGELARMVQDDGIAGVTSNPAIFFNAINTDPAYQAALATLKTTLSDPEQCFEALVLPDVQAACDMLRPLYDSTQGEQGYVSFEVSPQLAQDQAGTLAAARRLWAAIDRPNIMIKIPATPAGLRAFCAATADGINVNVTLIFSASQAAQVFDAYQDGLSQRLAKDLPIDRVHAVASVFISRVDTAVDKLLPDSAAALRGKIALDSAKDIYQRWLQHFGGARFATLKAAGGNPIAPLWASTGSKNPAYSDVLYVEQLIGAGTVNTVPGPTLAAFGDHGVAASTLTADLDGTQQRLAALPALGIDLDKVGDQLLAEGLTLFDVAFDKLLALLK